jgi:hypothetical protein
MTTISKSETAKVLAIIRGLHQPQDIGDVTVSAWHMTLAHAGVTSRADAVQAVVRHYATPGTDRWIGPADVIAGVKAIRTERLEQVTDPDLMADIDPNIPGRQYVEILRARTTLIADGQPLVQARAAVTGPRNPRYAITDGTGPA